MTDNTPEADATPDAADDRPQIPEAVEAIRSLGFDPERIQALVVTPTSVVAVDAQYPEPLTRQE